MIVSFKYLLLFISFVSAEKFEYLGDLIENDACLLRDNPRVIGKCMKTIDCPHEFESFRKNRTVLKICKYNDSPSENVICCSISDTTKIISKQETEDFQDVDLSYETCRDRYLTLRKNITSVEDINASFNARNKTAKDCENIQLYGNQKLDSKIDPFYSCINGSLSAALPAYGYLARLGNWVNMAALGWTQDNREVEYKCGGVIISDQFIITAAHCRDKGLPPDTIRVGDRFLKTPQDDEYSQQLTVKNFIPHPNYTSILGYDDIAVIKTVEKINFHKFVAPACIQDDNVEIDYRIEWNIAGYGQTETMEVSNTLIEIRVEKLSKENCTQAYEDDPKVPKGILPGQICVKGISNSGSNGETPDSCFGDSGGPVQYKERYKVKNEDYEQTLLKKIYEIPTVVGLVSFGTSCVIGYPSVNTRVFHYRSWIESIMKNLKE